VLIILMTLIHEIFLVVHCLLFIIFFSSSMKMAFELTVFFRDLGSK